MRSKKALANIMASLLLQITTVICGFIIPRLIISSYGSSVNGVISSITQFLGFVALLEAGVGGVVRAALYKPLATKDLVEISVILKSTDRFFRIIAYIFISYLIIVAVGFPSLVSSEFDYVFTLSLVFIIGASTFAQYFFGISYQLLLQADQRLYVTSALQIITAIVNTMIIMVLIKIGSSILVVKMFSALIFVLRPIVLHMYVKRNYKIIKDCHLNHNALKQKWDALGHHIAYFLHNNTDIVVLTVFTNIREVSVYSVYLMIVMGVRNIATTFSSGIDAALGNMIAKREDKALDKNFNIIEFFSFAITTILFVSAALLILPFISVYTKGITDANYFRPMFAYIFVAAEAAYCIRLPYHAVVTAAGHFKQTRNGAFVEALINIILSVALVNFFGLVGVAIGTLCAMLFRTFQYAHYLTKNILNRSIWKFIKRSAVSVASVVIVVIIVRLLPSMDINTYIKWCIYASEITIISVAVTFLMNILFYFEDLKSISCVVKSIIKKKFYS